MFKRIENANNEEMLKTFPNIVYKYLDWSNAHNKRIITHNELFFSSPKNFNDPFDCKIETRYDLMNKVEKTTYFTKVVEFNSEHNNLKWNNQKIKSEVDRLLKENDFSDRIKLDNDNNYRFQEYDNFYAVFCTSKDSLSIPMWGYYGNNHQGFSVGLSVREMFYSERIPKGGFVTYGEYPVITPNTPSLEKAIKETYNKSKDWSHENEFRLMQFRSPKNESNTVLDEKNKLVGIKTTAHESWYKEILLGVNCSEINTKEIIAACRSKIKNHGTKVYRLKRVNFDFKLQKEEINCDLYLT